MLAIIAVTAAVVGAAAPAWAAFPGHKGDLAFTALSEQGTEEIYTVPPDGGNLGVNRTRLTVSPAGGRALSPAWSADGAHIAFIERAPNGNTFVDIMDSDGGNRRRVTDQISFVNLNLSSVSWSPEGNALVHENGLGLFTTRISGGSTFIGFGNNPDWSPDGNLIVFECVGSRICTSTPTGANRQEIGEGDDPEWSPSGSRIAFTRAGEIWTMRHDGADPSPLTSNPSDDRAPIWSPRGDQIGFLSDRHLPPPTTGPPFPPRFPGIWQMNADGSDAHLAVFIAFSHDWQAIPNRPPDCTALRATPDVLLPANRQFRSVVVSGATDPDGDPVVIEILAVTQDEPVRGPGDPTRPDARRVGGDEVLLRAERAPRGDGRVYRIEVSATDDFGAECRATVKVTVPRHRARPAVESPESYDSFAR